MINYKSNNLPLQQLLNSLFNSNPKSSADREIRVKQIKNSYNQAFEKPTDRQKDGIGVDKFTPYYLYCEQMVVFGNRVLK